MQQMEQAIAARGFHQIWIETASVLESAVKLYEGSGYQPADGVETRRCDRVYSGLHSDEVHLGLCSGSINAAATQKAAQKAAKGCTSFTCNLLYVKYFTGNW
jgi:hypothetical protein